MTNSIYVHPPNVTVDFIAHCAGDISKYLRSIYKGPNFPEIEFINDAGLEYVPFLENDALEALSSILQNNQSIDIGNIGLAIDAYVEDGLGSRFCDVYRIGFSKYQDVVEFRIDQRCVLYDRSAELFVYIDYGDFSSIVARPEFLENIGLHNNIIRINNLESKIKSMKIDGFSSYYCKLTSLSRYQY